MDKTILIEYADMKEEIKDLRRRIEEDKKRLDELNDSIVTDSVTCGKKGKKPLRTVKIEGVPYMRISTVKGALRKKVRQLGDYEADLLELTNRVEEYIEEIPKSELRTMFRLYYVDNITWEMVAMRMNYLFPKRKISYTKDSCRIRHDRFLEKVL
ncbi:MAG: hypothetical protein ACRC3H_02610 [Lachnospiraceae bacterium]